MEAKRAILLSSLVCVVCAVFTNFAQGDVVSDRLLEVVDNYIAAPWPSPTDPEPGTAAWGKAGYALACLYRNMDVATANTYVQWLCDYNNPLPQTGTNFIIYFEMPLIWRMYLDPNCNSRLTANSRDHIEALMWQWVQYRSKVSDATSSVWYIQDSENHDLIQKSCYMLACQALKNAGPPYGGSLVLNDGKTVSQHLDAWTKYFCEYFRQRAKEGLTCEIASVNYALFNIGCCCNIWQLTDSPDLAKITKDWMTLYLADYACDFLPGTGLRGGSGTRWYKDNLGGNDSFPPILYCYGWHDNKPTATVHPFSLTWFTCPYRNPAIVDKIGSTKKRIPYFNTTRRFGKGGDWDSNAKYHVIFDANNTSDIRRDSWWHNDYVIGSLSLRTDSDAYIALNDQNRVVGVMFDSAAADRLIFHGKGTIDNGRTGFAEITSVCGKNCLVAARDRNANSNVGVRIFVSTGSLLTNKVDDTGWIFTKTGPAGQTQRRVPDNDSNRANDLKLGDYVTASTAPALTTGGSGQGGNGEAIKFVKSSSTVAYAAKQWASDDSVSVDFYFKADRNNDMTDQVLITAKDTWQVFINGADVKFTVWERNVRTLTLSGIVNPSAWQHVQASIGSTGIMSLAVDGATTTSNGGRMKFQTADMTLGNKPGYSMYYGGLIDTVRVSIPSSGKFIAAWDMDSFYSNDVYVGIRIANGTYTQTSNTGGTSGAMLDFTDQYSPVIFEVVPSADFVDFNSFKAACKARPLNYNTSTKDFTYTSIAGDAYEYWGNSGNLPKINGSNINLNPANTYDSPYLKGYHGMDTVKISYPGMSDLVLDFCYHNFPAWDDYQTIALWHMDAVSGGKILDDDLENSTRNHDLTLYNGLTVTTGSGGKFSEALNFDGVDDYGSITGGWDSCSSVKVDLWICPTGGAGTNCIVTAPNTWNLEIADGKLQMSTWHPTKPATFLTYPTDITLNQWHRVIATCDPRGNRTLTLDGNSVSDAVGEGLKLQNADINVGNKAGNSVYYHGKIDDLKITKYPAAPVWLTGDFNNDHKVDFYDFAMFAGQWLNACDGRNWCVNTDMDYSGRIDFTDVAAMAANWLIDCTAVPGDPACVPN